MTTLRGPPSTLLEPPSSAHHRLDADAFDDTVQAAQEPSSGCDVKSLNLEAFRRADAEAEKH